jgi:diguanylate cyclase (GGDEF)-like protein/PAS domain S-box-containing protein
MSSRAPSTKPRSAKPGEIRDHQQVISATLELAVAPLSLQEQLEKALDLLFTLPWLGVQARGAVFLVEDDGATLTMQAHRGMSATQLEVCSRVPFNSCLCGQVAASGEPMQVSRVDSRHTKRFEGMEPHGHVILPLKSDGRLIGVLNLYVDEGHKVGKKEFEFLKNIAAALVGIVERKRAEVALRDSETRFRGLLQAAPDALIIVNKDGNILLINHLAEELFGYALDELLGQPVEILIPAAVRERHAQLRGSYVGHPQPRQMGEGIELMAVRKDGSEFPAEISLSPLETSDGTIVTAAVRDITERLATQRNLKRLASFAEFNPNPVLELNKKSEVSYLNPAAATLCPTLVQERTAHPILTGIEEVLAKMEQEGTEATLREVEFAGSVYEQKIIRIPEVGVTRIYFWDITNMRALTNELQRQASHDALTGLINRTEFEHRLTNALHSAQQGGGRHVLLYIDLDQFKIVNDTCGHIAGDELLKQLTVVLKDQVREGDTLARLGGDEFGLLLLNCPLDKGRDIAESLRQRVKEFRFVWERNTFEIGLSVGLVAIDTESGELKDVLSAADAACYVAKEQGRNRVHVYEQHDAALVAHTGQMQWIPRIQQALTENRFRLFFQEIRSLTETNKTAVCGELLLRMIDEQGDDVLPMAFIPAAERYSLMPSVDRWVLSTAMSMMREHFAKFSFITINISGQSLNDREFLDFAIDCLHDNGINPEQICFEITETAAIANFSNAIRFIHTLKGLGCRFALDDFGSGLSSFAYLKSLPVDFLKIDGSIVRGIADDATQRVMVEAIARIGHVMGIKIIAEFVENESVLNELRQIGVDYAQGFGISKPHPLAKLLD